MNEPLRHSGAPARPSRASGWPSLATHGALPVLRTLSLCACRRHYLGAADRCTRRSTSPIRISLPQSHCRVGLRIVVFEACSAFSHVAAYTLARSPIRDRYPKTSDASSPPCLLRLLPAGADAGRGLHPLESAAFSRRTWIPDVPRKLGQGGASPWRRILASVHVLSLTVLLGHSRLADTL
jgi:hypothetical protein